MQHSKLQFSTFRVPTLIVNVSQPLGRNPWARVVTVLHFLYKYLTINHIQKLILTNNHTWNPTLVPVILIYKQLLWPDMKTLIEIYMNIYCTYTLTHTYFKLRRLRLTNYPFIASNICLDCFNRINGFIYTTNTASWLSMFAGCVRDCWPLWQLEQRICGEHSCKCIKELYILYIGIYMYINHFE